MRKIIISFCICSLPSPYKRSLLTESVSMAGILRFLFTWEGTRYVYLLLPAL